jgi:hypothetical protein
MSFRAYTAAEWKPIALAVGEWNAALKEKLEDLARRYCEAPSAEKLRAEATTKAALADNVYSAASALIEALEAATLNPTINDVRLIDALEELCGIQEFDADEAKACAPASAEKPSRRRYLLSLCDVWTIDLARPERPYANRVSKHVEAEQPAVAFMLAAANPVFRARGDGLLTPEGARVPFRTRADQARAKRSRVIGMPGSRGMGN